MMNTLNETRTMTAKFSEIPELTHAGPYNVINAWTGKNLGCKKSHANMQLEAHDTAVLIVQDTCGASSYGSKFVRDKSDGSWWH